MTDETLARRMLRDDLYAAAAAGDLDDVPPDELARMGLDYDALTAIRTGTDAVAWQNDHVDEPLRWWRDDIPPPPGWVRGDDRDAPPRTPTLIAGRPMFVSRVGDLVGVRPPTAVVEEPGDTRDRWWTP